jgi:hypothetical protein
MKTAHGDEDILVVFGGDRHLMSFSDIYFFQVQRSAASLINNEPINH